MKYLVVIERTRTGYSAYSPDLPGCVATGDTSDEVVAAMRESMALHLEGMQAEGLKPPKPSSSSTYVDVAA